MPILFYATNATVLINSFSVIGETSFINYYFYFDTTIFALSQFDLSERRVFGIIDAFESKVYLSNCTFRDLYMNPTQAETKLVTFLNCDLLSLSNLYFLRVNVSRGNNLLSVLVNLNVVSIDSIYFSNCFGRFHSLMAFVENSNVNILLSKQIVFESCEAEYCNFILFFLLKKISIKKLGLYSSYKIKVVFMEWTQL